MNIKKTKMIIINNHRDISTNDHSIGLNFRNNLIKKEKSLIFLGLTIDENLSWLNHTSNMRNKLITINYAIYKSKNIIPRKQLWMIYNAHFMTHLNYLNPIWNGCAENILNGLQRLQNRIIKNIENKPRLTPSHMLYTNRLNLRKYGDFQTILTIHKIKLGKIKFNFQLNTVAESQRSFLRNLSNYRPKFFRKEKSKKSIRSRGLTLYNNIPATLKEINSFGLFKVKLLKYLIEN